MAQCRLPYELQVEIIERSRQSDCRILRLVCKAWEEVATKKLFRRLHVRPNTRSIERARHVAAAPTLRRLVKSFAFCLELPPQGIELIAKQFYVKNDWAFLDRARTVANTQANAKLLVELLTWNYSYRDEGGVRVISERNREQILRSVINYFPNIDRVDALGHNTDWSVIPQLICHKRMLDSIESVTATYTRGYFAALLKAVSHLALRSVSSDATYINLDGEVRMWMPIGQQFPSHYLTHIRLGGLQTSSKLADLAMLTAFLGEAKHLDTLELELSFQSYFGRSRQKLAETLFQVSWPHLCHLSLSGFQVSEDSLINFLSAHASTLRTLQISDLEVPLIVNPEDQKWHRPYEQYQPTGSIVSLVSRIRSLCSLDSCTLSGFFTNRYDEGWKIPARKTPFSHDCLKTRIEQFMCGRTESPFVCAVDEDMQYSDESWKWWGDWLHKK